MIATARHAALVLRHALRAVDAAKLDKDIALALESEALASLLREHEALIGSQRDELKFAQEQHAQHALVASHSAKNAQMADLVEAKSDQSNLIVTLQSEWEHSKLQLITEHQF